MTEIKNISLLALRGMVLLPGMEVSLYVGRSLSVSSIERAYSKKEPIFCVAQRNADAPKVSTLNDLFEIGCVATITLLFPMPGGPTKVSVRTEYRARLCSGDFSNDPPLAAVEEIPEEKFSMMDVSPELLELSERQLNLRTYHGHLSLALTQLTAARQFCPSEGTVLPSARSEEELRKLALDLIWTHVPEVERRQELLEMSSNARLAKVRLFMKETIEYLANETERLETALGITTGSSSRLSGRRSS